MSPKQTIRPDGSDASGLLGFLARTHQRLHANLVTAAVTKLVVTIIGTAVTVLGVVMLVTPGPAIVVIPLGLAILATEYHWARRLLRWARDKFEAAQARSAAMDPAVRRRRRLLAGAGVVLVVGLVVGYVSLYDWPDRAVDGWDRVQDLSPWVPDLPGM